MAYPTKAVSLPESEKPRLLKAENAPPDQDPEARANSLEELRVKAELLEMETAASQAEHRAVDRTHQSIREWVAGRHAAGRHGRRRTVNCGLSRRCEANLEEQASSLLEEAPRARPPQAPDRPRVEGVWINRSWEKPDLDRDEPAAWRAGDEGREDLAASLHKAMTTDHLGTTHPGSANVSDQPRTTSAILVTSAMAPMPTSPQARRLD